MDYYYKNGFMVCHRSNLLRIEYPGNTNYLTGNTNNRNT